ncbi:hypothetical protein A1SA_02239 [Escherichia coli KTE51]|nr:hypothetical protein A1SA_02239 [Escherichia coli KTE51]
MKKTLLLCAFLVGLVSSNVMALTLDEARTQGRVGETFYGYLVALKTDAETEKLVADINAERKAGNDSNLLIVFYVQIMPDDFVMQLHRF